MNPQIPEKQFFKIGEVSRITGVKPHVLRYWESEFRSIRPQKTASNQRVYRRSDLELLLLIKQLLYEEGFTIAGARKRLRQLSQDETPDERNELLDVLREVRRRVAELAARVRES